MSSNPVPSSAESCKPSVPNFSGTLADPFRTIADLERQLAECRAERDEALQREAAIAEVLQVINSSTDTSPLSSTPFWKKHTHCAGLHFRIVKNTGDGFLAEFASVVDAVRCAVEVQRGMAERNA